MALHEGRAWSFSNDLSPSGLPEPCLIDDGVPRAWVAAALRRWRMRAVTADSDDPCRSVQPPAATILGIVGEVAPQVERSRKAHPARRRTDEDAPTSADEPELFYVEWQRSPADRKPPVDTELRRR